MFELLSSSLDKAVIFLGTLGYAGVFWASFLDRLTVFLTPAEIVLPAFGILISQEKLSFWPVMVWVTAGNFLGNLGLYFIQGRQAVFGKIRQIFFDNKARIGAFGQMVCQIWR